MRIALSLVIMGGLLTSCTQGGSNPFELIPSFNGIFSTRPQTMTHAMFLIKLKQKPLLADASLKEAIAAEQDQLLKELTALSSDIKVVYRYRMVLNAIAVAAPIALEDKIRAIGNVAYIEKQGTFSRPVEIASAATIAGSTPFAERNSAKFIGAEAAHARGIRGQGLKVGVIDTGVDYTHAMFGGAGTEQAYRDIDPSAETPAFPNAKVVGGMDFVGTEYNSGSADYAHHLPKPDLNPLDEGGHGTHVAGTVAGIGDGVNTYDGVAPDALIYALKVFGKGGSTGDAAVIAALEYSADPNTDADGSDRLDVVNLSLGSGYGEGHILYTEAIGNLSRGGTSVVCSGGNSGDQQYIVGAPGVADDALSVAASTDDMDQNWKFRAVKFATLEQPEILVEAIEAPIAKKIEEAGDVGGPLVFAGYADQDFNEELKTRLNGRIALIDRGVVPFAEKIRRAVEAGALGVVVANNQAGEPIAMGGDGKFDVPAIMIRKELGQQLKAALAKGEVLIQFNTPSKIEKPELVDTITGFSSKGPRSQDALIKPEIAAPGSLVISARMGGGAEGVAFSGTSMAAPHMAGVMALLKQAHPGLSSAELKALVMGTAKTLVSAEKKTYPVSRQGAGRVQIAKALDASVVALPSALSLGEVTVEARKTIARTVELRNIAKAPVHLSVKLEAKPGLRLSGPSTLTIGVGERSVLALRFTIDMAGIAEGSVEFDGWVKLMDGATEVGRIPVLAIANKVSQIRAERLMIRATSAVDSQGAAVDLTLANPGLNGGDAYPFNLIGRDGRKEDPTMDIFRSKACDLAEAGYRVVNRGGASVLQIAVKTYEPMTTWNNCEVSVLIDGDGDRVPDQELVGAKQDHLSGLSAATFASILLDASAVRALRKQFELDTQAKVEGAEENYTSAIVALEPMHVFDHSTVVIVEAPVELLKRKPTGELAIRVATTYLDGTAIEPDDFLAKDTKKWISLNLAQGGQGFVDLPEKVTLGAGQALTAAFTKGAGREKLLMLYPSNKSSVGSTTRDLQSEIVNPVYEPEEIPVAAAN